MAVLIGWSKLFLFWETLIYSITRGTYEPGPFGVIGGDPFMGAVKTIVPGARGYAMDIRTHHVGYVWRS
jgi:hypothetical protein